MKKRLIAGISAAVMALSLNGCGSAAKTYTDYVQAVMDCTYKNEQEKYIDLTDADATEAQAVYDDEIDYIADLICYNFAVDTDVINDGMMTGYKALARSLAAKAKYSVEPAVLSGKVYHITVICEPMDYWDIALPEIEALYDSEFSERFANAEGDAALDALEIEWGTRVLEVAEGFVDQISYKSPVNTIVEISTDDDGRYGISDKNWIDIDDLLLDLDSNTGE